MKIAFTSGKGGTGKTTLSTGLYHYLSKIREMPVQLVDCDVEEPNCALFLNAVKHHDCPVNINPPHINTEVCTFCGRCREICAFNSIVMLPSVRFIEVVEEQCHACGACAYVCPENAITEEVREIGRITAFTYRKEKDFLEGRLRVGSALQTPVIRELLKKINPGELVLLDAPPGASCPVVAVVNAADFVVVVTEPTPFGLNDLKIMVETLEQVGRPFGVVVNKTGMAFPPLYDYLSRKDIRVLAEIPFSRKYAEAITEGKILTESFPEIRDLVSRMYEMIRP